LGSQLAPFLQKHPFSIARVLAQHFPTSGLMINDIFRENWDGKILAALGAPFMSQNIPCVEASMAMLQILHKLEENHFERIATFDESWFQYSYPS
jgi:hypothetical protein